MGGLTEQPLNFRTWRQCAGGRIRRERIRVHIHSRESRLGGCLTAWRLRPQRTTMLVGVLPPLATLVIRLRSQLVPTLYTEMVEAPLLAT